LSCAGPADERLPQRFNHGRWLAKAPDVTAARGQRPTGNYSDRPLGEWARNMADWKWRGLEVFCYFDNDHKSAALQDGKHLMELLRLSR
jgi:uncharacterized protein YecE (DUF72 family)